MELQLFMESGIYLNAKFNYYKSFFRYYGQGNITEDNYIQFIKHDTLSSEYLNQSKNFVVYVRENFEILKNQGSEYWTWQSSREQVISIV